MIHLCRAGLGSLFILCMFGGVCSAQGHFADSVLFADDYWPEGRVEPQFISEYPPLVGRRSRYKDNPWIQATRSGDFAAFRLLVERHGIDAQITDQEITPLVLAAEQGYLEWVKYLIDLGADVNTVMPDVPANDFYSGNTALISAAANGQTEMIRYLVEQGADINHQSKRGWSPLLVAVDGRQVRAVRTLVELGADVNALLIHDISVLHQAAVTNDAFIVELLIRAGADIHAVKDNGMTPLHDAAFQGSTRSCKLLILFGADLRAKTNDGKTPMDFAQGWRDPPIQSHVRAITGILQHYAAQGVSPEARAYAQSRIGQLDPDKPGQYGPGNPNSRKSGVRPPNRMKKDVSSGGSNAAAGKNRPKRTYTREIFRYDKKR